MIHTITINQRHAVSIVENSDYVRYHIKRSSRNTCVSILPASFVDMNDYLVIYMSDQ